MNSEQIRQEARFHDEWAGHVDVDSIDIPAFLGSPTSMELSFILSRLGDIGGKRVLDVGCGLGEASVAFAMRGAKVTAMDASPGMVDVALKLGRKHGVVIEGCVQPAEETSPSGQEYDVVYAGNTLHHLGDQRRFLSGVASILSPEGVFCSWDPIKYNPIIGVYRMLARDVRTRHERPLGIGSVRMLKENFGEVEIRHFWLFSQALFLKYFLLDRIGPNDDRYWKRIYTETPASLRWWLPLRAVDNVVTRWPIVRWLSWNMVMIARRPKRVASESAGLPARTSHAQVGSGPLAAIRPRSGQSLRGSSSVRARDVLSFPRFYSAYQGLIGASSATRWMIRDHWRVGADCRILDFGCGPGAAVRHLPDGTEYVGVDIDAAYIERARRAYRSLPWVSFRCGSVFDMERDPATVRFDVILALGVFHHIPDAEAHKVLASLAGLCRGPESRLLCFEPCLLAHQDWGSRFIIRNDRGAFPRSDKAWLDLFSSAFGRVEGRVANGLYRIPYMAFLAECTQAKR